MKSICILSPCSGEFLSLCDNYFKYLSNRKGIGVLFIVNKNDR